MFHISTIDITDYGIVHVDASSIVRKLATMKYSGTIPAFTYKAKIETLLAPLRLHENPNNELESILKYTILQNLTGSYFTINAKFSQSLQPYTISDILSQILIVYNFTQTNKPSAQHTSSSPSNKPSKSTSKKNSPFYTYCRMKSHKVSDCFLKQNAKKRGLAMSKPTYKQGNPSSKTNAQKKTIPKSTNNIQVETPSAADTDAYYLRPTQISINTDQHFMIDSGAGITAVKNPNLLYDKKPPGNAMVLSSQNIPMRVQTKGTVKLKLFNQKIVSLPAVYIPELGNNLLSERALENEGIFVRATIAALEDTNENILANYVNHDNYIWLPFTHVVFPPSLNSSAVSNTKPKYPLDFIHWQLGHVNIRSIQSSLKKGTLSNISYDDVDWNNISKFQCSDCLQGKSRCHNHIVGSRLKYQSNYGLYEYLHSDVFGPVNIGNNGYKYFITFTHEATHFRWVFPIKDKSVDTVLPIFKKVIHSISRQFKATVLAFQLDRGSEYTNTSIQSCLSDLGIDYIYTTTADSRAHGVAGLRHPK